MVVDRGTLRMVVILRIMMLMMKANVDQSLFTEKLIIKEWHV